MKKILLMFLISISIFSNVTDELIVSVKEKNIEKVREAISNGADLNFEDMERGIESPLNMAIQDNSIDIVKLLITSGAEINEENLNIAAQYNAVNIAKILFNLGVNPTRETLETAIKYKSVDIINLFISLKYDLSNEMDMNLIRYAVYNDSFDILNIFLKYINFNSDSDDFESLFLTSIEKDSINSFKILLNLKKLDVKKLTKLIIKKNWGSDGYGIIVDYIDDIDEKNILNYAISSNAINIIDYLISKNYKFSDKAILNLTYRYVKNVGIISESMINEFEKVTVNTLNILMKYKINIDAQNEYEGNNTMLMLAIENNKVEIAKTLINNNANTNIINKNNESALIKAVSHNNIELVKLLIEHGANVNIKNEYGEGLIKISDSQEIRKLLMKYIDLE